MAHEISKHQGRYEFFAVREPAWHRLGEVLEKAPSFDEAMKIAGLNFTVVKRPLLIPAQYDSDGVPQAMAGSGNVYVSARQSSKAFVTFRTDSMEELGSVGPDYSPVQNADALRVIEPFLDTGILTLETGGSLRQGADCFLLGRFNLDQFGPVVKEVFADEVIPYVLFQMNHNGRRRNAVALTPVKVVCANTLALSEGGRSEVQIKHTGDAVEKTIEAAENLLGGIIERYEAVAKHFKVLKENFLTEAVFQKLVLDVVSPDPRKNPKFNPEARKAELVLERHEKRVDLVKRLWSEGTGHVGDSSAWEAYNGTCEAIDWHDDVFPGRGGAWQRGQSLVEGVLKEKKVLVLNSLLKNAGATEAESDFLHGALGN